MTLAAPAAPAVFCLCHARPAVDAGQALDGVHRNVTHPIRTGTGQRPKVSLVLGTRDEAEALGLVERRRMSRLEREHPAHRTAKGIHRDCPKCKLRGAHLGHIEASRLVAGCLECERAQVRAWSAKVGR